MRVVTKFGMRVALAASLATCFLYGQDLPLTQVQTPSKISPLDPTKNLGQPELESSRHTPLAEEYIWTANDANANDKVLYTRPKADERIEPHFFRRSFTVAAVPREATLYIAGPRSVDVWLNGMLAEHVESDVTSPLGMHVFAEGVDGPALLISDKHWKSATAELAPEGWERARFDDAKWAAVQSIGSIESSI